MTDETDLNAILKRYLTNGLPRGWVHAVSPRDSWLKVHHWSGTEVIARGSPYGPVSDPDPREPAYEIQIRCGTRDPVFQWRFSDAHSTVRAFVTLLQVASVASEMTLQAPLPRNAEPPSSAAAVRRRFSPTTGDQPDPEDASENSQPVADVEPAVATTTRNASPSESRESPSQTTDR